MNSMKRLIYWDSQDSRNEGPAYRDYDGQGNEIGSGALEFAGWSGEAEGYNLHDYFGRDGEYLGADQHGIEPILIEI